MLEALHQWKHDDKVLDSARSVVSMVVVSSQTNLETLMVRLGSAAVVLASSLCFQSALSGVDHWILLITDCRQSSA